MPTFKTRQEIANEYGMERKYRLYISQDPNGKKQAHLYGFLRDKKVILRDTKEIGIHSSKSLNARISQNHE